jgi:thymidylate synthase (FAD)
LKVEFINKDEMRNFFKKWGTASAICYNSPTEKAESIGKQCLKSGHFSGSRGLYFMFKISGISRACSLELNRHEIGVMKNQQSQRYVNMDNFKYTIPKTIESNKNEIPLTLNNEGDFLGYYDDTYLLYQDAINFAKLTYKALLDAGVPKEDARLILPEATHTEGVYGFTLEALMNLCNKRLCSRAWWEIRELVQEIANQVIEILPELKPYLVPNCEKLGYCPEGKKNTCGKKPLREEVIHD